MNNLEQLEDKLFTKAYGILCQSIPLHQGYAPLGSTFCRIEGKSQSSPHQHSDGEVFIILSGRGVMNINGTEFKVGKNSVVSIPPFSKHFLTNSDEQQLEFISLYWDTGFFPQLKNPAPNLTHSAPPTPNGRLHLGHLSGPYLASDIYTRSYKWLGGESYHVCGSDDNQSYVSSGALKEQKDIHDFKETYKEKIKNILKAYEVKLDYFLDPHKNEEYESYVQDFFQTLVKNGRVKKEKGKMLYCEERNAYLHESFVSGGCPHCGSLTNGQGCEACGYLNNAYDLIDPKCNISGNNAVIRTDEKYVFDINPYLPALAAYYKSLALNPKMRQYLEQFLAKEHDPITVSFKSDWGIKTPQLDGQVIFEWLEMAAGYLYQSKKLNKDFYQNPQSNIIWSFGFDNSYFYLGLVPALLLAYDPKVQLPKNFLINEFYLLEGEKFSTSRNHAIWGDEVLERVPACLIRLYITASRPEGKQTNFSKTAALSYLSSIWIEKGEKNFKKYVEFIGEHPNFTMGPMSADISFAFRKFQSRVKEVFTYYNANSFKPSKAMALIEELLDDLQELFSARSYLSDGGKNELSSFLYYGLKVIFIALEPICPTWSNHWLKYLLTAEKDLERAFEWPQTPHNFDGLDCNYLQNSFKQLDRFLGQVK